MSKFGEIEEKAKKILRRAFGEQKDDFWGVCKHNIDAIDALTKDIVVGRVMLNQRQCLHLSRKLSEITFNIEGLLSQCKKSKLPYFKPALVNMLQYLEKARVLVENCGDKNWLAAAVFQSQNENAFREILFDVGLCYNAIYEQARSLSEDWDAQLKDLRSNTSSFILGDDDIHQDYLDLQKKLEAFVHEPTNVVMWDQPLPMEICKCLASYLLVKMQFSSQQSHGSAIDSSSPLLWQKEKELKDTWGESKYLGSGANEGGVCSTKWLGTPCAKKEFHVKEYESLFLKEARIMASLKHPCIINFICCGNGQAKGDRFIAMELMQKSLYDLIQEQEGIPFSLPMVVDIIVQIARGMWYLHDLGIAHRDLKPENVVLNRLTHPHLEDHFCLKLVDFGTSKTKVEASKSNTMTCVGVGTKMYRAPEVHPEAHPKFNRGVRGKVSWLEADIFSFAMTCAHILTLRKPFEDKCTTKELFNAVMNGARPSLPNHYPEELLDLLRDCWNIIPHKRPSFRRVCERLEILRYKIWRGYFLPNSNLVAKKMNLEDGVDFCKTMINMESSLQRSIIDGIYQIDDNLDDDKIDIVAILPCLCGRGLELLNKAPYENESAECNVCHQNIYGNVYHCGACSFDAHPECVEIEDKVEVFFHHHPLYLLIRNYYNNNLAPTCYLCDESVQQGEWVYHCGECDLDVHALCTKYPEEINEGIIHFHPLTMIQCHLQKIVLSAQCCNREVKRRDWHYKCKRKSCAFRIHPVCSSISRDTFCVFDHSHRLNLVSEQRLFHCGRCGSLGYSWFYQCEHCKVKLHLDCNENMIEEMGDQNGTYEKFMIEYEMTVDDHSKTKMISKFIDKALICTSSKASSSSTSFSHSSSSSSTLPAMMIVRPTKVQETILNGIVDDNLLKEIVANNEKKKVEKMALMKEAMQKQKVNLLEINGNLKKNVEDLQSSKTLHEIDKDILSMTLEKLKERCSALEHEVSVGQGQGQMSDHGPRIVLFFSPKDKEIFCLLTSIPNRRCIFTIILLCEEPGHEHIADAVSPRMFWRNFDQFRPLLRTGLQFVTRAMKALPVEPSTLDVTLSIFGEWKFNVSPLDLETYNLENLNTFEGNEDVEALKKVEDFAVGCFFKYLEDCGIDIFKSFGLRRVRYTMNDERKVPCFSQGSVAWLCDDHLNYGLEAGTLELCPSKFYNRGYDIIEDK